MSIKKIVVLKTKAYKYDLLVNGGMVMINKQNLWFLTLFSLILVLSIYYLTLPEDTLEGIKTNTEESQEVIEITESDVLAALRVERDEEMIAEMNTLREVLLNNEKSVEEKNQAYESLKDLNLNKGEEEKLEKLLLDTFNLKCFVQIKKDQIKVVVADTNHSDEIANNIIRKIQENFDEQMFITVKFQ